MAWLLAVVADYVRLPSFSRLLFVLAMASSVPISTISPRVRPRILCRFASAIHKFLSLVSVTAKALIILIISSSIIRV